MFAALVHSREGDLHVELAPAFLCAAKWWFFKHWLPRKYVSKCFFLHPTSRIQPCAVHERPRYSCTDPRPGTRIVRAVAIDHHAHLVSLLVRNWDVACMSPCRTHSRASWIHRAHLPGRSRLTSFAWGILLELVVCLRCAQEEWSARLARELVNCASAHFKSGYVRVCIIRNGRRGAEVDMERRRKW